jgi:hypothetical protein
MSNSATTRADIDSITTISNECCSKLLDLSLRSNDGALKHAITCLATDVRANFQSAVNCANSLFQANVQHFLQIIDLQRKLDEQKEHHQAELKLLQGRIEGMFSILEDQRRENQVLLFIHFSPPYLTLLQF